ncbi:MAG: DUF805 domain-containing protein [Desulfovibrio sp.]|nr:DUF805 domain-containing protein [Desulfovibrio sp.]
MSIRTLLTSTGGNTMQCSSCGSELPDGATICPACGRNPGDTEQEQESCAFCRLSFKEKVKACFASAAETVRNTADFKGRAGRCEFFSYLAASFVLLLLATIVLPQVASVALAGMLAIPGLTLSMRRMRDAGVMPWIPLIPLIWPLVFILAKATGRASAAAVNATFGIACCVAFAVYFLAFRPSVKTDA